ncbi:phosphoribosyltransferase [Candidatus Micrarchaeota archaeon]|nr:phosphoribosyltransferase [Candidatus Micrarchaeota archaeon]
MDRPTFLSIVFRDRADAGKKLAAELKKLKLENVIVLGIPRGGVVTAARVARELNAPLSIVVARKVGAPGQPELAAGAVSENGIVVLNEYAGAFGEYVARAVKEKQKEVEARVKLFRGGKPLPSLKNKTALIVDDGIATGASTRAAVLAVKKQNPKRVVLAVPVAPPDSIVELAGECEVVCLVQDPAFLAVGAYYQDFREISDGDVVKLLKRTRKLGLNA